MSAVGDPRAIALGVLTDTRRGDRLWLMASLARAGRVRVDDIIAAGFTRRLVTELEQRGLVRARTGVVEVLCIDADVLSKWLQRAHDEGLVAVDLPRVDPPAPSEGPARPMLRRKRQAEARVTHASLDGDGFTMLLCLGPMSPKDFEDAGLWAVYQAFARGEEAVVRIG